MNLIKIQCSKENCKNVPLFIAKLKSEVENKFLVFYLTPEEFFAFVFLKIKFKLIEDKTQISNMYQNIKNDQERLVINKYKSIGCIIAFFALKGLFLRTGIQYGATFIGYENEKAHGKYLIWIVVSFHIAESDSILLKRISKSVNKIPLLVSENNFKVEIKYL